MLRQYDDGDVTLYIDDIRRNGHEIMHKGEVIAEVNFNRRQKKISIIRYTEDQALINSIIKITHDIILNSDFRLDWKAFAGIKSDFILTEDGVLLDIDEAREMAECGLDYTPFTGKMIFFNNGDSHETCMYYRSSSDVRKSVSCEEDMEYHTVRMTSCFPLDVRRFDDFKNTTLEPKCSIDLAKHHVLIDFDLYDTNTKTKSRKLSVPGIYIENRESERTVETTICFYHDRLKSNSVLTKITLDLFNIGDHVDIINLNIPRPYLFSDYKNDRRCLSDRMITSLESIKHSLKKKIMIPRNTHHEIIGGMIDYELANPDGPPHIEIESLFHVNNGGKLKKLYNACFGFNKDSHISAYDTLKHFYTLRRMIRKIRKTMEKKQANFNKYAPDYMK